MRNRNLILTWAMLATIFAGWSLLKAQPQIQVPTNTIPVDQLPYRYAYLAGTVSENGKNRQGLYRVLVNTGAVESYCITVSGGQSVGSWQPMADRHDASFVNPNAHAPQGLPAPGMPQLGPGRERPARKD